MKSSKTIGLFLTAAAVGAGSVGLLRYNANAADFLAVPLSEFSEKRARAATIADAGPTAENLTNVIDASVIEPDGLYRFSMEIVGVSSAYKVFSLEVVARGASANANHKSSTEIGINAQAILTVQKKDGGPVREYTKTLDAASFGPFWQDLRRLEVAQLINLSPQTEMFSLQWNSSDSDKYARQIQPKVTAYSEPKAEPSSTYRFTFQDGLYDYPNSFEVYAPDALEDARYRDLRDLTHYFTEETFAEEIFTEETFAEETLTEETFAEETFAEEPFAEESFTEETLADETFTSSAFTNETLTASVFTNETLTASVFTDEILTASAFTDETFTARTFTDETF
ncbi:MAG: hypothetical protein AAF703_15425 [Cyanobacteria bacterium P01_D01_bin.105]